MTCWWKCGHVGAQWGTAHPMYTPILKEVFPERDVLSIRFPCRLCCLEESALLVAASSAESTAPKTAYSPPKMSLDGSQLTASV